MASTYLQRTLSASSSREQWTFSAWVKISGNPTGSYGYLFSCTDASSHTARISIMDNNVAKFGFVDSLISTDVQTNRLLRDNNSWYHLMVVLDTTLSTASDRVKLYVNGVRETSLANTSYPSVNAGGLINYVGGSYRHNIGSYNNGSSNFFNGIMSDINFSDGYALEPTVFGETDATTGEWKIIADPTFTPGTNGFTILKNGNTITDQSTNSNNWSLGGGTLTNSLDCPSNVFATMNPLATSSFATLTNGNNTLTGNSASNNGSSFSTLSLPDARGKYYFEVKFTTIVGGEYPPVALCLTSDVEYGVVLNGGAGDPRDRVIGMDPRGYTYNGSSNTSGVFSALSNGDIASFAFDMDNGAYYMSINGAAYLTSGNPTSGASRTGALVTWTPDSSNDYGIWISPYNNSVCSINFGNGYFGTSAVTSAGTAGSTPGTFEYDVPSGYQPLSTKGLNA